MDATDKLPQILEELRDKFSLTYNIDSYGMICSEVENGQHHEILEYLCHHPSHSFEMLTTLFAVHYPDQEGKEFAMVYVVKNLIENLSLTLKVYLPASNPSIKTVSDIYESANWQERQEFDFFGINFIGHPNLMRILNVEDMDYHPMRKEYKLEDPTREDKEDKYFGR
ncbi:MAG: NADH-quinone oxidoreductase subunit C [Chitinophagales bacterium]|jgi:NADH-quinone oxidoreductase subunit C|nr:NADH-quinone oxidoreductase subunit C [Chitinophagales bacterium]